MNEEETKLAKKIGFDWVKIHPKNIAAYDIDYAKEIKFYLEYAPKFIKYSIRNFKRTWLNFLLEERDALVIENYALMNKKMNEKHGEFKKDNHLFNAGVTKALELTTDTQRKMAHVGEKTDFNEEVKKRTEPYLHKTLPIVGEEKNEPTDEEIFLEKKEEIESNVPALGEIIKITTEEVDDGRREEEERT